MYKKYEFTGETKGHFGATLRRIRRLSDGLVGGWIEKEENLSQEGTCFVYDEAIAYRNGSVLEDATISGTSEVFGNAAVSGFSKVSGCVIVHGNATVTDNTKLFDMVEVCGNAIVGGDSVIRANASISNKAYIQSSSDVITFSNVGSKNGTLTAYRTSEGDVELTIWCFRGSIEDFLIGVEKKHGDSKIGRVYQSIAETIKIQFDA